MCIASLFIIAKKVKTNQMSIKYKIDKLWYILRMEYYLEIKINKLQVHGKPQISLKKQTPKMDIILFPLYKY